MPEGIRQEILGRTNKNQAEVTNALARVSQVHVAEMMGSNPTAVHRLKEDRLRDFCAMLAACGLKVVSESHRTYPPDRIAALTTLARAALSDDGPASSFGTVED